MSSKMTLEERIAKGSAIYFRSITYDPAARTLLLEVLRGPESNEVSRTLTFREVTRLDENWHDRDDSCLESLIGLDERPDRNEFVIHTDQREIALATAADPDIVEVGDIKRSYTDCPTRKFGER